MAFTWAGLAIEDSNTCPVRQHYYEKIIQTYLPKSVEEFIVVPDKAEEVSKKLANLEIKITKGPSVVQVY